MFAALSAERQQLVVDKTTSQTSPVAQFYCKLCDVQCTSTESFDNHTSGLKHCKKFLTKQNDLGFDEFERQYRDVPFNKRCGNVPPPSSREEYALQVYRSGLANKFTCKACGANTFQMLKWFEHVYSHEHGQKIQSLQNTMSRALFLNQFGDLPGPNPKLFTKKDERIVQRNSNDKVLSGHEEDGLEYPFNLNLDSLTTPQSSVRSSSRSDNQRPSTVLPSNHVARETGRQSQNNDIVGRSRNHRLRREHHQQRDNEDDDDDDDDECRNRKRMKAVRIMESPVRHRPYSPQQSHFDGRQNRSQTQNDRMTGQSSRYDPRRNGDGRVTVDSSNRLNHNRDERRHHSSSTHHKSSSSNNSNSFSFQSVLNGGNSSDDVLRQTLREFLANVVKQQPPNDKAPNDDKLFRSLCTSDQRHLLNIHALTDDDSVWRCYGAVKFLRALDPQLLTAISRLVEQPSTPTNRTACNTRSR